MSGHSKWSTIKRAKGILDAKRGALFTKLSKDITVAAKLGGSGDLEANPMLKMSVNKAKAANMTLDKIQKAINRGLGVVEAGEILVENTYEAYAPGQIPLLIDSVTDNSNRAITDIRSIIHRSGGKMLNKGSISWQFREVGKIELVLKSDLVDKRSIDVFFNETILPVIMEIEGIEDIVTDGLEEGEVVLITRKEDLNKVYKSMTQDSKVEIKEASLAKIANSVIQKNPEEDDMNTLQKLIGQLEELNDVENVWIGL